MLFTSLTICLDERKWIKKEEGKEENGWEMDDFLLVESFDKWKQKRNGKKCDDASLKS